MFGIIGGIAGYYFFRGFYGAIIGYFIGSFIDRMMGGKTQIFGGRGAGPQARPRQQRRATGGGRTFRWEDFEQVTPGDFELNLLSLASIIIKADGRPNQQELDYVRKYFVQAYGKDRANATFKTFNQQIKNREISAQRVSQFLASRTRYESRLQILRFLFGVANSHQGVSNSELQELQAIAGYLRLQQADYVSIKNMYVREQDNAYKILQVSKSSTDKEIKDAFRAMAKKYHPDKVGHLGDAHRTMAEEKFKEVQAAYEKIKEERGIA